MSDWRDVMEARAEADRAASIIEQFPASYSTDELAVHALLALRLEIRALAVTLNYAVSG